MIQGWRPTSATIQPSSAAIQGSGMARTATFSSQGRASSRRRALRTKKVPVSRMKNIPSPTMARKAKNIVGT